MTVQRLKLEDAIRNREKYIKMMMKMDEKTLIRNIDLFQQQMVTASKSGHHDAYALLNEYEMQTSIALANKGMPKSKKQKKAKSNEVLQNHITVSPTEPETTINSRIVKTESDHRDFSIFNLNRKEAVEKLAEWYYSELSELEREYTLNFKITESMYIKNRLEIVCKAINLKRENDALILTL